MRIAYLCWTVPHPPTSGGKQRSLRFLHSLAARHEVHLRVPSWEPVELSPEFTGLFASLEVYRFDYALWLRQRWQRRLRLLPSPALAFLQEAPLQAFHSWVRRSEPDLIFVDEAPVAPYAWPHRHIPAILSRQKVEHLYYWDVYRRTVSLRGRLYALADWLRHRLWERRLWRRFPHGVVVSEAERRQFLSISPWADLAVIPNGADVEGITPRPWPVDGPPTLLLHGLMSYFPNIDAAHWFVTEVAPRVWAEVPDARLLIAGDAPGEAVRALARAERIVVTGGVPDMRLYLERSHVAVVPLRVGHGTRVKILEAFAAGRPVVSTSVGAENLEVEPGRHLLVADEPAAFAAAVVALLRDRARAEGLARQARELVEARYSWDAIGTRLEAFCRRVAGKGPEPPAAGRS